MYHLGGMLDFCCCFGVGRGGLKFNLRVNSKCIINLSFHKGNMINWKVNPEPPPHPYRAETAEGMVTVLLY